MVMTSNIWLTPKIAAMDEVVAFDLRYAQQINVVAMFDAQQTAALMTMYPMMKPAIDRFEKESVNMDGTSVLTVATLDLVASAEQAAEQAKEQQGQSSAAQAPPTSLGLGERDVAAQHPDRCDRLRQRLAAWTEANRRQYERVDARQYR